MARFRLRENWNLSEQLEPGMLGPVVPSSDVGRRGRGSVLAHWNVAGYSVINRKYKMVL